MKVAEGEIDLGHFWYTNIGFHRPPPLSLLLHAWRALVHFRWVCISNNEQRNRTLARGVTQNT